MPVVPLGGPLAGTSELERELVEAAFARVGSGQQLVLTTSSSSLAQLPGLASRPGLPRWVVTLDRTDPARWRIGSRNPARGVSQSHRAGVTVREATSDQDLRAFYRLYLRAQRRLRGLPRRYRQLELTRELLATTGCFRLFLAEFQSRPVAGAVWLAYGSVVEGLYYGGDERFLHARPNHALYAHVLEWARTRGYHQVDFGVAQIDSSLAYFKSQWGAEPVPTYFYVYPSAAAPSDPSAPPAPSPVEVGDVGWLAQLWRLAPLQAIRAAGAFAYTYL